LVDLNAKEAIPEITKCLKDLNKLVQSAAKEALEKIR
jgi:HEAT repeat protein